MQTGRGVRSKFRAERKSRFSFLRAFLQFISRIYLFFLICLFTPMPTAMATIEHATQLLDFSQKLDITLLDSVVSCFYMAHGPQVDTFFHLFTSCRSSRFNANANLEERCPFPLQQRMADQILTQLKQHPDAWTRVDTILEFSNNQQTKV